VDFPANHPRHNFEANPTIEELIAQQGKGPIDMSVLRRNAKADDEPIEAFLTALHEWRGHSKNDSAA
jgi:hypothetical protein